MDNITFLNVESLEHMLGMCCYKPRYKLQVITFSSDLKEECLHHAEGYIADNYRLGSSDPLERSYQVIGKYMRSTTIKLSNSSEITFISGNYEYMRGSRCHHILLDPALFGRRNLLIELGHRLIDRQSNPESDFRWTVEWVEYHDKTPNIDVTQPVKRLNTANDGSLTSFLFKEVG